MSKKQDLKFANEAKFLQDNPHFSVTKVEPNFPAIRAVLRTGVKIDGVELVDIEPKLAELSLKPTVDTAPKQHKATDTAATKKA